MPADMSLKFRNRINELGTRGRREEGKILRAAGEVVADRIASHINRSNLNGPEYKHMQDNIIVSRTRTNQFGERYVQISSIKELGWRLKFLEFGTSKTGAQMPVSLGAESSKDEVAQILSEGMERIMRL